MLSAGHTLSPSPQEGDDEPRHARRWWMWARIAALAFCILAGVGLAGATRSAAQETEASASCRIGVDVLTIHRFNIDDNTFDAGFWIWSVCPADEVKTAPGD